jgi:hypothetical protein
MNACTLFNQAINNDVAGTADININFLKQLLDPYSTSDSGIWRPLIIKQSSNKAEYCDPLIQAGLSKLDIFDPCNCSPSQISSEGAGFYQDTKTANLDCSYCGDYTATWKLYDINGDNSENVLGPNGVFSADCCGGACDVRFKNDDFLPKLPVLNQTYLSGFYDFKHHLTHKFPACTNPGLGFERFISFSTFNDLNVDNGASSFCIDWKLKETISEIDYDPLSSYHLNEYSHTKSKNKSDLVSKTCGNFILTSVSSTGYQNAYNIFDDVGTSKEIPSTGDFIKPYGFENLTYNNLFIGGQKLASHWKWNYTSGILGWYRYYDQDRINDNRPIKGVDLYISDGDVFWTTIDGPEKTNLSYFDEEFDSTGTHIKECPSGLKIVDGTTFKGIVPEGSECIYISNNIYPTFYSLYEKYLILGETHKEAFRLAAIRATAPQYDGYTVDLLHQEPPAEYSKNIYKQIDRLNKDMLTGTAYGSSRGLNYIQTSEDLVNNLYYKYGGYIWIPPNTNTNISLNLAETSRSIYVDIDFDMVVNQGKIIKTFQTKTVKNSEIKEAISSCSSLSNSSARNFTYDQTIKAGSAIVSNQLSDSYRHQQSCSSGDLNNFDFALYANLLLNDIIFSSVPAYSGSYILADAYPRITTSATSTASCNKCGANSSFYLADDAESLCVPPIIDQQGTRDDSKTFCYDLLANFLNNSEGPGKPDGTRPRRTIVDGTLYDYRRYKALAFNPHIDLVAFHEQGGVYVNSSTFGANNAIVFDKNVTNNNPSNITIGFNTRDVGIKLYSIYIEKLQSSDTDSYLCKRFPIETDNICKCYGLNLSQYGDRNIACNSSNSTYRSSTLYIPSLSTVNSPPLQYYGGYTPEEVQQLFGITVSPMAGTLPDIDAQIDPENPYSCDKIYSISLLNYTTRSYNLKLQNFSTDHADVYVSITENIDYTGPAATPLYDEYYQIYDYATNYNWKRFLNRVDINDNIVLYNRQKKVLYKAGDYVDPNIAIKITNPFLEKIVGEQELSIPTGDQCSVSAGSNFVVNGVRGDELSTVNLSFVQKPRKQLLTFTLNKNTNQSSSLINFTKGYFLPDQGLRSASLISPNTENTALVAIDKNGRINYGNSLYTLNNEDTFLWDKQSLLYTRLNNNIINTLNNIDSFAIHRKPRLYLQHGGKWYTANFDNKGGFTRDDKTYIGSPKFFEYIRNPLSSKKIGCAIPAIPKKPISLSINNKQHFQSAKIIDEYTLRLEGSLVYTMTPEKLNIIESQAEDIEAYVAGMSYVNLDIPTPNTLIKINEDYFLYIGINITDLKNYIYIGDNPDILSIKSNLEIDYDNIAADGYVYDTYKECDIDVLFYDRDSLSWPPPSNVEADQTINIISKKLIIKTYNDQGQLVSGDYAGSKRIKIYTDLVSKTQIHANIGDTINIYNDNYDYIWDELISTDTDIRLSNQAYNTKWGDLVRYDGFLLNNPYINDYRTNILPTTPYENLFYKQIVNDNLSQFIFGIAADLNTSPNLFEFVTPRRFFLLQKYNYFAEELLSSDLTKFQNYLPILFMNTSMARKSESIINTNPIWQADQEYAKIIGVAGPTLQFFDIKPRVFYSSALMNIYDTNDAIIGLNPEDEYLFINDIQTLDSAFVPNADQNFHVETLRLDDPIFWLDRTIKEESANNIDNVRKLFKPQNMNSYINTFQFDNHFTKEIIKRSSAFYRQNIYADMDSPKDCGPQEQYYTEYTSSAPTCLFRNAGTTDLTAQFAIAAPQNIDFANLNDNVVGYIGYEAGLYNTIGNNSYVTITRTELPIDNPIETSIDCSNPTPLPLYKNRTFLSSYQDFIEENKDLTIHSTRVKNTDLHANEMLFRILYGEKQVINKQQLFIDKPPLTKNDLINYSDPIISAKDIYGEILYNYDKNASSNLTVNGSLTVNGTKEIGDGIFISIGNINITLSILLDATTQNILLEGNIGNKTISTILYQGSYVEKSLLTQYYFLDDADIPDTPEPTNEQETIDLVAVRTAKTDDIIVTTPATVRETDPNESNTDTTTVGVGVDWARVFRSTETIQPCHPGTKPNDPFTFGYCRVDDEQEGCDTCDKFEQVDVLFDGPNFIYRFEDCDYQFELYGHSYRYHYAETDTTPNIPDTESTEEDPGGLDGGIHGPDPRRNRDGTMVDYPPAGASCPLSEPVHIRRGCIPETCRGATSPQGCAEVSIVDGRTAMRKVYIKSISQPVDAYQPSLCPTSLFTITYNNNQATISVPSAKATVDPYTGKIVQSITNKTYCVPLDINNNCPEISASFSNRKYSISETIESSCNENCQNDADIAVDSQKINYTTQDFTAVCVVGTFSYANVNGGNRYGVSTSFRPSDCCDDFGGCFAPCLCNTGGLTTLCDGSGAPWKVCENPKILSWGGNHNNYWAFNLGGKGTVLECDPFDFGLSAHGPTAEAQAQVFENRMNNMFNKIYAETNSVAAYGGPMHECQVEPEIANENIFEGVIPGSCTLEKYVSSRDVVKAQVAASGGVRFDTMTITYIVYYIKYKYRTTATTQSSQAQIFDSESSDDIIEIAPSPFISPTVETNNPIAPCTFNAFPDSYKAVNYFGDPIGVPSTYIKVSPFYNKGACEDSISCYNNLSEDGDKQTICNNSDWMCWSMQDLRNSYKFLSRLTNETWK